MAQKKRQQKNKLAFKFTRKNIFISSVLVLLIAGSTAAFIANESSKNSESNSSAKTAAIKSLGISSNPDGLELVDKANCANNITVTPLVCELDSQTTETTVTAKPEVQKDGKTYYFQSWNGCSESNEDWKICKVSIDASEQSIMAKYVDTKPIPISPQIIQSGQTNSNLCPNLITQDNRTTCQFKNDGPNPVVVQSNYIYNGKQPVNAFNYHFDIDCSNNGCEPIGGEYYEGLSSAPFHVNKNVTVSYSVDTEASTQYCGRMFCSPPDLRFRLASLKASKENDTITIQVTYQYLCTQKSEMIYNEMGGYTGNWKDLGCET